VLPQHWHLPPSLVKTIFFVVSDTTRLWEKQQKLKKSSNIIKCIFFIVPVYLKKSLLRLKSYQF